MCSREPSNVSNRYAVAMVKDGTTIGRLFFVTCSAEYFLNFSICRCNI